MYKKKQLRDVVLESLEKPPNQLPTEDPFDLTANGNTTETNLASYETNVEKALQNIKNDIQSILYDDDKITDRDGLKEWMQDTANELEQVLRYSKTFVKPDLLNA